MGRSEIIIVGDLLTGGNVQTLFRVNEAANGWYQVDILIGWQAVVVRLTFDGRTTVN
ncbi:MAG: hypothetical protein R2867_38840 [Caldilineaceae bacterium]